MRLKQYLLKEEENRERIHAASEQQGRALPKKGEEEKKLPTTLLSKKNKVGPQLE